MPKYHKGKKEPDDNMNAIREQYNAYKKDLYKDYPQVEKFEKTKSTLIKALLILFLVHTLLQIYNLQSMMSYNIFLVAFSTFLKVDWIFLFAAFTPRWQLSICLYILAGTEAMSFMNSLNRVTAMGITSLDGFLQLYASSLQQFPTAAIADFLLIIYIIATLIVAIWLTLPSKNRELAEQSDILNMRLKDYMKKNAP